jgi:hypothetical protein
LAKKVALALTSDLLDVLLTLLHETKSDFLGEVTPALRDKTAKLTKIFRDNCSEKQFKRTTVQKEYKMREFLQI